MLFKTTTRLFKGTYQYKVVLVCAGAHMFRYNNYEEVLEKLSDIDLTHKGRSSQHFKSQDDIDYAFKLTSTLNSMSDIDVRIESPWVSIYTNKLTDIDSLVNLDNDRIKYICKPPANTSLKNDTIIMPKMDFDYRVTLGKTNQECTAFISWANNNKKCKLTKSCITALTRPRSWGGTHFYITGDNNLLMAKMHLGGSIAKVERIVKN
jgi:hypothetical protein